MKLPEFRLFGIGRSQGNDRRGAAIPIFPVAAQENAKTGRQDVFMSLVLYLLSFSLIHRRLFDTLRFTRNEAKSSSSNDPRRRNRSLSQSGRQAGKRAGNGEPIACSWARTLDWELAIGDLRRYFRAVDAVRPVVWPCRVGSPPMERTEEIGDSDTGRR